jgi:signal transduction histidine kinase/ActR/RegA family two-component response regulator
MIRLSFRTKLLAIVGSAAFALVVIVLASTITANRVERQMTTIQERYLPRVELEPKLEALFEQLRRGFQDAVGAHDQEALDRTREARDAFLVELRAASAVVDAEEAEALRRAVIDYHAAAHDVSQRLLAAETGEALVDAMASMQAKQSHALALLKKTTSFDRAELADAFSAVKRAQASAAQIRLFVAMACLLLVLVLSVGLSRSALRSLTELAAGFERFGAGRFGEPIQVSSDDELADVAAQANAMAASIGAQEERLHATNDELEAQQEELRRANDELTRQTAALTTVSAYKSQFLANMSHELRTPLNSMLLLSQLLADNETKNLTDKQVEYSRTIHSAGNDLLALINQVLDLAKVEAGKQEVRIEDVRLRDLADHAKRVFGQLARSKGLRFVVELEPGMPETIPTDRGRATQILNNLIANAIKFTDRGAVVLRIACPAENTRFERADLGSGRSVAFVVADTGVGIAPEHHEHVFAPFEQVEAASDRRYGGTGLGLTISRELATLLGGELQLSSKRGVGSTFTLFLPRRAQEHAADGAALSKTRAARTTGAPPAQPAARMAGNNDPTRDVVIVAGDSPSRGDIRLEDRRVLVVDDDMRTVYALSAALRAKGVDVLVAETGRAALAVLHEHPDIEAILLDVMMPDMDGYEATRLIREDTRFQQLPIIAVTAKAMKGDREMCIAAGASDYLPKPIDAGRLLAMLEHWLAKGASERVEEQS